MNELWWIQLLGGLRAEHAGRVITRFRSHKTGALLAYLAFHSDRTHRRDLLTELLWPEVATDSARMWLRTALASLRRQLEPPPIPAGTVIVADRLSVGMNPAAVTTDVAQFEAALQAAARLLVRKGPLAAAAASRRVNDPWESEEAQHLVAAVELYRGELLPGYFEGWILPQQQRLAGLLFHAVRALVYHLEQTGDAARALDYAARAVAADPLREEGHYELIRLYAAAGRPAAAVHQYRELERLLGEGLGEPPSEAIRQLVRQIERGEIPRSPTPTALSSPAVRPDHSDCQGLPQSLLRPTEWPQVQAEDDRGYLPPVHTRFFGREAEIARLRKLLLVEGVRLVTLTGPGGSGKTRLAVEVATRLREALDGAVWFVSLADLSDPRRIVDVVHAALDLPRTAGVDPLEQMAEALARRPSILVLDNFEQLVPGGIPMVRDLLERIPMLQCLVTSRQILELTPEREVVVGPLPVPHVRVAPASGAPAEPTLSPDTLIQNESVALFIDRAQRAQPDFQLTLSNAVAVAELCRRLEGIPLAIELAAARVREFAPARMLTGLERRFELLVSRKRDLPSRHQTLRAAMDWSYRLLAPKLQRFLTRLFVFRGGFTPEVAAAVAVSLNGQGAHSRAQECLATLRDNSLVQGEQRDGECRYWLLETLREYMAELLSPEERADVERRHAQYYLALAEAFPPEARVGPLKQKEWLDRLETEMGNLRAALDWAEHNRVAELGLRLALALDPFWRIRSYLAEARDRLSRLLELAETGVPEELRARALSRAAWFAQRQSDYDAARRLCEEALGICRRLGDRWGIADTLRTLGGMAQHQGDCRAACCYLQESLTIYQELEDRRQIALCLNNLGLTLVYDGQYERARQRLEQALSISRERSDPFELSINLNNMGLAALRQGRLDEARSLFTESLRLKAWFGNPDGIPYGLEGLAELATAQGQLDRAVHLFAAAGALRTLVGHPRCPPTERANEERLLALAREALGAEAFDSAWTEGRSWAVEQAVEYATCESEPTDLG